MSGLVSNRSRVGQSERSKIALRTNILRRRLVPLHRGAVPRFAWAIVLHHTLTFLILLHPLRYEEHSLETCRDGIVELNTFFLIARRQGWHLALYFGTGNI